MIRRLRPRPFTWNGGWQQKRPFPTSEFQVEASCFHLEQPIGTGSPPPATTVPGGKPGKPGKPKCPNEKRPSGLMPDGLKYSLEK